jgi:hypothetical protein
MSRTVAKTASLLGAAIFFSATLAIGEKAKIMDIYPDAILPSGGELKAGKYRVVVKGTAKQVDFVKGNTVVATSGCQIVEKEEKNSHNEARFVEGPDKKQRLRELRLSGEKRSILLVQPGM